ncbi:MAG: hypothetical protein GF310_12385 [candidate division Zixibacteria bacterium]|nr:hypothetical protein [candidate division Zixibacteria bacterium]
MRKFAPLFLVLLLAAFAVETAEAQGMPDSERDTAFQPTLVYEDFDDGELPSGWQIIDGGGDGYTWDFVDITYFGLYPPFDDTAMIVNSSAATGAFMEETLLTAYYYCPSDVDVHLSFSNYFAWDNSIPDEIADVDVRNGADGEWHNILRMTNMTFGPDIRDINITSHIGDGDSVQVRFHYYFARDDRWWMIDNFKLYYDCEDPDGDNICSQFDNCPDNYNPNQIDYDSDGIGYACDTCVDTDEDGYGNPGFPVNLCDIDNCPDLPNPDQLDYDGDGVGDACDQCTDTDGDGFGNPGFPNNTCPPDNCPNNFNPYQTDADGDGRGDQCDYCTDTDGDSFGDPGYPASTCMIDNCPNDYNPYQWDRDGDDVGDSCDDCTDTDSDGFGNPGFPANTCQTDNCPEIINPEQLDDDSDGIGNECDSCTDLDGDGYGNPGYPNNVCVTDNCPDIPNPDQADADDDGLGDSCDVCTDSDEDGYGDPGYPENTCEIDNCPDVPNSDQEDFDQDGIGDLCDECTDSDNDGYGDPGFAANTCDDDNCPDIYNPEQSDADADGLGDSCDVCTDIDNDGFGDPGYPANTCQTDNCPGVFNPGQEDSDEDGAGDLCDICPLHPDDDCCNPIGENDSPVIDVSASIVLEPGDEFSYEPNVSDSDCDGSELEIGFIDYPSWCEVEGSSISGTAECDHQDTSFTVVASDGDLADSATVIIEIDHSNQPPVIADTLTLLFIKNGRQLEYCPAIDDPDDTSHTILYESYPYWCTVVNDSLTGTAPDENRTDTISVTVQDYCSSDGYEFRVSVYICGDTNGDDVINVSDAVYLINFIFIGGQSPEPLIAGECNCDANVNVSDAVYIINYVFISGPSPCHDCP